MKIIDEAFEFRTISKKRSDLKRGLSIHGFKFFTFDEKTNMLTGICKRKHANKSVY
ncbi:MAG: hypothetical protein LBG19_05450 [Prevotellaceae bacterium]|nr:hypothetical protein [Prevotellaceae bacterium]